jgi:hypothetical protein
MRGLTAFLLGWSRDEKPRIVAESVAAAFVWIRTQAPHGLNGGPCMALSGLACCARRLIHHAPIRPRSSTRSRLTTTNT